MWEEKYRDRASDTLTVVVVDKREVGGGVTHRDVGTGATPFILEPAFMNKLLWLCEGCIKEQHTLQK
jgi:hypothetical protein